MTVSPRKFKPFRVRRQAHLRLGARGERAAVHLLKELGLTILMRNYRTARGEIDIVARDGKTLCFVEVKTRHRGRGRARPADAVGPAKRRRIVSAARQYLRELGHPPIAHRFDIVGIALQGRRLQTARHWPAAFTEEQRPPHVPFPAQGP